MEINSKQLRSARAYLDVSRNEVADATSIGVQTLSDLENEKTASPRVSTLNILQLYYETNGVEFTKDGGIRPNKVHVQQFEGVEGFRSFMNDVYEVAKSQGGDICLFNTQPALWPKYLGEEWYAMHVERMASIGDKIKMRIAIRDGDDAFLLPMAEYLWIPKDKWKERTFYAYGNKLGFLSFDNNEIQIIVIQEENLVDSFRTLYDMACENNTTVARKSESKK
jgi:transcriptional regulator with XRE-family HTH domain